MLLVRLIHRFNNISIPPFISCLLFILLTYFVKRAPSIYFSLRSKCFCRRHTFPLFINPVHIFSNWRRRLALKALYVRPRDALQDTMLTDSLTGRPKRNRIQHFSNEYYTHNRIYGGREAHCIARFQAPP